MERKDQFASVIIEIMSSKSRKYRIDMDGIQFVDSTMFHCTYSIQTPMIPSINKALYQTVTLESFFTFIQSTSMNRAKYPILYRLSVEKGSFWCIQSLPHILKWMSLIHSKYSSTLSQNSCNALSIEDVLNAAKYNQWGDFEQWTQKWQTFRKHSNELMQSGIGVDSMRKNSIYSSLIGSGNETVQLEKNRDCIDALINAQNEFLMDQPYISIDLFDIKPHHLVDCSNTMLNIIIQNAKLWVCYDTHYEKECLTYIILDLNRIQQEIYNVCIAGRHRLKPFMERMLMQYYIGVYM